MNVDKLSADLVRAGQAYLATLRRAATDSGLPMLATMADAFEAQHLQWVPQRLAAIAETPQREAEAQARAVEKAPARAAAREADKAALRAARAAAAERQEG